MRGWRIADGLWVAHIAGQIVVDGDGTAAGFEGGARAAVGDGMAAVGILARAPTVRSVRGRALITDGLGTVRRWCIADGLWSIAGRRVSSRAATAATAASMATRCATAATRAGTASGASARAAVGAITRTCSYSCIASQSTQPAETTRGARGTAQGAQSGRDDIVVADATCTKMYEAHQQFNHGPSVRDGHTRRS